MSKGNKVRSPSEEYVIPFLLPVFLFFIAAITYNTNNAIGKSRAVATFQNLTERNIGGKKEGLFTDIFS